MNSLFYTIMYSTFLWIGQGGGLDSVSTLVSSMRNVISMLPEGCKSWGGSVELTGGVAFGGSFGITWHEIFWPSILAVW